MCGWCIHRPVFYGCDEQMVTDFGDCLLIPAMNDMHVHAPQYRNQGIAMDLWLQNYTFPEEKKYVDVSYAERMYRRFIRDLWRFGTMWACVFATIHTESTRLLMHLFQEAGMGAMVGKVAMNRNCPLDLAETLDKMIQGNEALIAEFNQPNALVRPIITPRFVPSCTPDMLQACGDLAAKYQMPVQSHLSENLSEIALVHSLEKESTSYGDAYNRYGLFGQTPTIMAHCVWTAGEEPGYEFDALVIDDHDLNYSDYSLLHRLERYIYLGDDRQIVHRFCRGEEIPEPKIRH